MNNKQLVKVPFVDLALQNQPLEKEIQQAINRVIQAGDFVLGKALEEFEQSFAKACGVQYGVGVASGTDAIALGLQACGIGAGDEVIVPVNTFMATIMGVIAAGATPILVDCDSQTALIDLGKAAQVITKKTKAILPVHLYGQMVSPKQLLDWADTYQLIIFEDAAQAHLAARESVGAGTIGMATAFSFYPSKNLGAYGNGGMLITQDEAIAQKVKTLRNYGAQSKYYHTEYGKNSRLDTIQAAILQVKLPHLSPWNQLRNQAAKEYDKHLKKLQGITLIENSSGEGHVYHLYVIRIKENCAFKREQIRDKLTAVGVETGIHYPIPCHLQPACKSLGYERGDFPQAESLCSEILSLPMYPGITKNQIAFVCEQLSVINEQSKLVKYY
ncbi:MAG: DegT/DnrJ/EryC1/StrS family aminotransferase [Gomphosphaeria aponina SAG 52.96 = DSM 107014]|uniref:DegT/DnrJ/EryC1/StrS family aminotransferase n=1 Tax=Gomphosphaeria aponina SAG 52.96 = DSM 107014 TaxID=1521640 RepID=A0A941GVY2_9CHRO|nr:DegT/DnrJ/EryC1/StrS family aminotransferase [Gomphosphaeria aponina SAG 52.96 = DSM 107014]